LLVELSGALAMPIIWRRAWVFNDSKRRLAFQFGRQSCLRSTDEVVEQLEEQYELKKRNVPSTTTIIKSKL
jgi:hypothetical protein